MGTEETPHIHHVAPIRDMLSSEEMAAIKLAKKELRKSMRQTLSRVSKEAINDQCMVHGHIVTTRPSDRMLRCYIASKVHKTLLSMPEWKAAQNIAIYLSMSSGEISTAALVHRALEQQKTVYVPYTYPSPIPHAEEAPSAIMDMLSLHSMQDFQSLEVDKWGIPTPSHASIMERKNIMGLSKPVAGAQTSEEGLDMMLMPGMAFDTSMGRLGHGKGFYDFFLTSYAPTIGPDSGRAGKMPFLGMNP